MPADTGRTLGELRPHRRQVRDSVPNERLYSPRHFPLVDGYSCCPTNPRCKQPLGQSDRAAGFGSPYDVKFEPPGPDSPVVRGSEGGLLLRSSSDCLRAARDVKNARFGLDFPTGNETLEGFRSFAFEPNLHGERYPRVKTSPKISLLLLRAGSPRSDGAVRT